MRRYLLLGVVLAATCGVVPGAGAAAAAPGILYALDAKGAIVTTSGKASRLSLPANAPVTWFTDRPERRAGSTNLRGLEALWAASGFADDPPNAALILTRRGDERTHVVELTRPRFADGRVSFALREIPTGEEAGIRHVHDLATGKYDRARLFIDDAAFPPCAGAIAPPGSTDSFDMVVIVAQCLLAPGASTVITGGFVKAIVYACSPTGSRYKLALGDGPTQWKMIEPCAGNYAFGLIGVTGKRWDSSSACPRPEDPVSLVNRAAANSLPVQPLVITIAARTDWRTDCPAF